MFSESAWYSAPGDKSRSAKVEQFAARVVQQCPDADGADFLYYYQRCEQWSQNRGAKSRDWPATAAKFILEDRQRGQNPSANSQPSQPLPNHGKSPATARTSVLDRETILDRASRVLKTWRVAQVLRLNWCALSPGLCRVIRFGRRSGKTRQRQWYFSVLNWNSVRGLTRAVNTRKTHSGKWWHLCWIGSAVTTPVKSAKRSPGCRAGTGGGHESVSRHFHSGHAWRRAWCIPGLSWQTGDGCAGVPNAKRKSKQIRIVGRRSLIV